MREPDLRQHCRAAYQAVLALSKETHTALADAGIDPQLAELVRIRVSQLNGCAHCLRLHTRQAIANGETSDRLAVLPAWRESQYFTSPERAALALAEELTELPQPHPAEWDNDSLTAGQVAAISWLTIEMNSWNRIAIQSRFPVAP